MGKRLRAIFISLALGVATTSFIIEILVHGLGLASAWGLLTSVLGSIAHLSTPKEEYL